MMKCRGEIGKIMSVFFRKNAYANRGIFVNDDPRITRRELPDIHDVKTRFIYFALKYNMKFVYI